VRKVSIQGGLATAALIVLAGCQNAAQTTASVLGGTGVGGLTPTNSLEQIYYLGVFDPREQIPQSFYRVTVRGQASAINLDTKFSSGWVPSALIDGLGTNIDTKLNGTDVSGGKTDTRVPELNDPVKRMFMVGPEGIRVSPADHRLVIVMGSSPEGFFEAVDSALGSLAGAEVAASSNKAKESVLAESRRLDAEEAEITQLRLRLTKAALRRASGSDK
jgi:hypothetical protein